MLLRNYFYDKGILRSTSFELPVICVGNLSVGGTGKTPMIEYLLTLLTPDHKTATLSRGYGRETTGFRILKGTETAKMVGDEPLQFKNKFPDAIVAVDEKRGRGISALQKIKDPEIILLDDAFQHRKVKAGMNILLTAYGDLYVHDNMLPTGNLREPVAGAKRAKMIVVTKCPRKLAHSEQKKIRRKLRLTEDQDLYFSYIDYSERIKGNDQSLAIHSLEDKKITLITGIANPQPLLNFLNRLNIAFEHHNFPDHHNFSKKDIEEFADSSIILTTEKDFMRLRDTPLKNRIFYIPIKMCFVGNASVFDQKIESFVAESRKQKMG